MDDINRHVLLAFNPIRHIENIDVIGVMRLENNKHDVNPIMSNYLYREINLGFVGGISGHI